jgi:ABC-2 type transport system permease protein
VRWAGRAPGWRWLLAHELRLSWRGQGGKSLWFLLVILGLFWVFCHFVAWHVMREPSRLLSQGMVATAGLVTWFVVLLVAATAFGLAIIALFERSDFDLLLSSPIPPRTVLAVRGLGVAVQSLGFFAIFAIPFANGALAHGHWRFAAAYPALLALGLGAAAFAFATTLALVRAFGARRARTVAQIAGAFLGAGLFLLMQSFNFLSRATQEKLVMLARTDAAQSVIGPESVLWWPYRALVGDSIPFIAVTAACVAAFVSVVVHAERLFLDGSRDAPVEPARRTLKAGAFASGLSRVVVAKEMRLILRDPKLITSMLLQVLYLLPLFFMLLRKGSVIALLAPTILLVASSLAGNLAFLTVSAEESPDLVGSAPVSRERVLWLKVAAAMLVPLAICVPFIAYYATVSAASCAIFAACLTGALGSSAAVQVWTQKPGSARDLRKRAQSSKLVNLVEFFSAAGWAAACYLLLGASWWAIAAIGLGLVAPTVAWLLRRSRRD